MGATVRCVFLFGEGASSPKAEGALGALASSGKPVPLDCVRSCLLRATIIGSAMACTLLPSTVAVAQTQPGCTSTLPARYNPFTQMIGGVVGAANSITAVIGTINTAFPAQGNAFAAGLPNAQPDQLAGGIWMRTIGGRVENQATGTFNGSITPGTPSPLGPGFFPGGPGASGSITCNSDIRQQYGGFQLGQDLARLNLSGSGATLHMGVTGGYAEAEVQDLGGSTFNGGFQVPFAGAYATYTNGKFFADLLVRSDFYQMNLSAAPAAMANQRLNALGLAETTSAAYRIELEDSWFLEPSVSGIHSSTKVDTLNMPGGNGSDLSEIYLPPGSVHFATVESWLGRAGVRVGTGFSGGNVVWQPFATASVWHEFARPTAANYAAPQFNDGIPGAPFYPNGVGSAVSGSVSGSRVGTYGQYSLGIFGQVTDSPWLGYLRFDYKDGANIEALGFNAGLRYQFDPTKTLVAAGGGLRKAPPQAAYDWTGFYVGGFSGAGWGRANWYFPQTTTAADPEIAGLLGGLTAGYNKQLDRWVVGFESDVAFTNATGGQSCQDGINNFNISSNCNNDIHVLATTTVRVGYSWYDRVLLFFKVGGAWTNNRLDVPCNGDALFTQGACIPTNNILGAVQDMQVSDPRFGGAVGGGFELALTPTWSAKVEYDYLDFGSRSLVLPDTTPFTQRLSLSELKFGLNYHFGVDDPSSATAAAAVMPVKAPPGTPYTWTGGYIGVEATDRLANASWTTTAIPSVVAEAIALGAAVPDPSTNPANYFSAAAQGGGYLGYDWQLAPRWVTGIEGDIAFGHSSMTLGGIPGTYGNGSAANDAIVHGIESATVDSSTVAFGWDGTLRARVGYLSVPSILVYGTGGIAFQQASLGASCNGGTISWCSQDGVARSETASTIRVGWTAGGGLEGVLAGDWVGKLEFRYADLGHFDHDFFSGTPDEVDTTVHLQTYTFLAGLGYKFHGSGNPIP